MNIEEILIVKSSNILYALETKYIDQILHVPEFTKLLLSPKEVLGLTSISGRITTSIDLNLLFQRQAVDTKSLSSRIITMRDVFATTALVVDEVINTLEINEEYLRLEDKVADDGVIATYEEDNNIIQIFSPEHLFAPLALENIEKRKVFEGNSNSEIDNSNTLGESERFLLFMMEDEYYSIAIDSLREIIAMRDDFTPVAGARDEVEGVISLRDELIVVIDLRKYYNLKVNFSDDNRILIASISGKNVGFIVDKILDIRDYQKSVIDILPRNFDDKKLSGVIHAEDGLVSVIGDEVLQVILQRNNHFDDDTLKKSVQESAIQTDSLEVVKFLLKNESYALDIEYVVEIIDYIPITKIADTTEFIRGVINIRGKIIPIVSFNYILNIEESSHNDSKILICRSGDEEFGFIVDEVTDILEIPSELIFDEKNSDVLFDSVLHLEDGKELVMLLNIEKCLASGTNVDAKNSDSEQQNGK